MATLRKKQLKNAISGEIDFDAIWDSRILEMILLMREEV